MSRSSFVGGVLGFFYALLLYVAAAPSLGAPIPPTIALLMAPFSVLLPVLPGPQVLVAVLLLSIVEALLWYLVASASSATSIETTREVFAGLAPGTVGPGAPTAAAIAALTGTAVAVACPPPAPALPPPPAIRLPVNVMELFARGTCIGFNAGWNLGLWAMLPFFLAAVFGLLALLVGTIIATVTAVLLALGPVGATILALLVAVLGILAAIVGLILTILAAVLGPVLLFLAAVLAAVIAALTALVAAIFALIAAVILALLGPVGPVVVAILAGLGPLGLVGALFALINFLALIPVVSRSAVFQGILGWSSWLMPMSWLATFMGFLLFVGSVITAPFFPGVTFRLDVRTGTIETDGGLTGISGFPGGFNLGNFTFVLPVGSSTGFVCPGLSVHETGHTLNVAAFGSLWHLLGNAIEENVLPMRRGRLAYGELLTESHLPGTRRPFIGIWS